jgi:SAM-dependent methyltransferase
MNAKIPYVLGTGDDELQRLGLQHRLWSDAFHAACKRAGLRIGHRVLDVGCGPGFASFDLAQLVTPLGAVVAVDESEPFLTHVTAHAKFRNLPHLRAQQGDVQQLDAALSGEAPFDLAYARWVLCFVADPAAVVRGIAKALRPGARFVVHDYFNYGSMTLAPRSGFHDRAVAATRAAWGHRGGDPDVVGRLPAMLDAAGFTIEHLDVHQRVGRGTDSMFGWVDTWWHTFAPKLVGMGLLSDTDAKGLLDELSSMRGDPLRFAHCPPVYEVVARRN